MSFEQMNKNISEYKTIFTNLKEDEPELFINNSIEKEIRSNMINWLLFLSNKLNFNTQTLFRCVIIFDKFIHLSNILSNQEISQEKLNLVTIACLSLATKLEEINCNYVSFFTEKVLNLPNYQIYTVEDLTKMEFEILKVLKYKTLYSTAIDFLEVYLELFKSTFLANNEQMCQKIKLLTENLLKQNLANELFLTMAQSDFALLFLTQILVQMGMNQYFIMQEFNIFLNNNTIKNSMDNMINDSKEKYKKINMKVSPIQTL